jgi:hypothetical protein
MCTEEKWLFCPSVFYCIIRLITFCFFFVLFKMSALPSTTTLDEYLNEQLINCINIQTNVIQNLAQYSQHISLQLFEIKVSLFLIEYFFLSSRSQFLE